MLCDEILYLFCACLNLRSEINRSALDLFDSKPGKNRGASSINFSRHKNRQSNNRISQ